jgi:DNA (cytosine-5)-methyltransferase 1
MIGTIPDDIAPTYKNRFESIKRVYSPEGLAPTIQTFQGGGQVTKIADKKSKIRKLTPKECWRLMGFSDDDFAKAKGVPTSDAQLYKQAGNSICVNVLMAILDKLLIDTKSDEE